MTCFYSLQCKENRRVEHRLTCLHQGSYELAGLLPQLLFMAVRLLLVLLHLLEEVHLRAAGDGVPEHEATPGSRFDKAFMSIMSRNAIGSVLV